VCDAVHDHDVVWARRLAHNGDAWGPVIRVAGGDLLQLTFRRAVTSVLYAATTDQPDPAGRSGFNADLIPVTNARRATDDPRRWTLGCRPRRSSSSPVRTRSRSWRYRTDAVATIQSRCRRRAWCPRRSLPRPLLRPGAGASAVLTPTVARERPGVTGVGVSTVIGDDLMVRGPEACGGATECVGSPPRVHRTCQGPRHTWWSEPLGPATTQT
jgi:hypothetical protein